MNADHFFQKYAKFAVKIDDTAHFQDKLVKYKGNCIPDPNYKNNKIKITLKTSSISDTQK